MKLNAKTLLIKALLLVPILTFGQITNTFPDDGNAGVGTTTPTEKLEVVGNTKVSGTATAAKTIITDNGVGAASPFPLQLGSEWVPGRRNIDFLVDNDNARLLESWVDGNGKGRYALDAYATGTSFYINDENGNNIFKVDEGGLGNDVVFMHLQRPNSRFVIGSHGLYEPDYKFVVKSGSALIEGNVITNDNLGIGTSTFVDPADNETYNLSVNGKVRAHEIKVYTGWADYVFKDDYDLKSLEEVEAYINKNGHLPNIPSEKEVEENGIKLGQMNAKLLEKIEELTLYLIEQKKEIETLKGEVQSLKTKN